MLKWKVNKVGFVSEVNGGVGVVEMWDGRAVKEDGGRKIDGVEELKKGGRKKSGGKGGRMDAISSGTNAGNV